MIRKIIAAFMIGGLITAAMTQTIQENAAESIDYKARFELICDSVQKQYIKNSRTRTGSPDANAFLKRLLDNCPDLSHPFATLTADVQVNSAKGSFAQFGKNIELQPGKYMFRLAESTVRYGEGQKVSPVVLLRMNIETKDAYLTLNGIGDIKTVDVPVSCSLSIFFVPGEPTYDDSGSAQVEIFRL